MVFRQTELHGLLIQFFVHKILHKAIVWYGMVWYGNGLFWSLMY